MESLPVEIFDNITECMYSIDLKSLFSVSKLINYKLINGGLHDMHFPTRKYNLNSTKLPRRILKLCVDLGYIYRHFIAGLPLGLLHLDMTWSPYIGSRCIKLLPYGLQTLNMVSIYIPEKDIKRLPRTLTCLEIANGLTNIGVKQLPRELTHLKFSKLNEIACDFPPNLLTLNIRSGSYYLSNSIKYLPRSLTCYDVWWDEITDDSQIGELPPGLLKLQLGQNEKITHTGFSKLPLGLQSIKLESKYSDLDIKCLPKNLTYIEMDASRTVTGESFKSLSRSLNTLKLNSATLIEDKFIKDLPESLTVLDIASAGKITDEGIKWLPRKLIDFILSVNNDVTDDGLAMLPRGLLKLTLNTKVTDKGIENLPKSLLTLRLLHTEHITDAGILALPRTLKLLSLDQGINITDEGIKHLPVDLEKLELKRNSILTNECIKWLPRRLNTVVLRNSKLITNESYADLPKSLTYAVLGNYNLTKKFDEKEYEISYYKDYGYYEDYEDNLHI